MLTGVLSDDGHWIAFTSTSGNVVPDDHNAANDVFVRPGIVASG